MVSVSASAQLAAAESSVLALAQPERGALVARGADRVTWLNGLLTCDVTKVKPGGAAYGLATTQKGRVLADLVVLASKDSVILSVPAASRADLRVHFERYLIMEDAEIALGDEVFFAAHGPKAAELAARPEIHALAAVYDLDVTGRGGVVFVAPPGSSDALAAELARGAESLGGVFGDGAGWEAVRLERSVPAFGADFDGSTYPQEASLERRAVSFDKGCYLGQEVVCMLEMRGHVKRKLVPIEVDGVTTAGTPVTDASGVELGKVTSAYVREDGAHARALAMVKLSHTTAGAELRVGTHAARVVG